jgi:hypothetical protein
MTIRIFETDFDGNPVDCTGEILTGSNALEIVEAMQMNPFNASLTPLAFMEKILTSIGKSVKLPSDDESAAELFLQTLVENKYATILDDVTCYIEK